MAGLYVACWLTTEQATPLAVGTEAPEDLHLTLCCLGDEADLPDDARARAEQVLRVVCTFTPPIEGEVSGIGKFMGSDQDVIYASVDAPALSAFRQRLVDALVLAGLDPDDTHGFTPHITLSYVQPGEDDDVEISAPQPIVFRSACVMEPGRRHLAEDDIPIGVAKSGDEAVMRAISTVAERVKPDGGYGGVAWNADTGTVFWQSADWTTREEIAAAQEAFLAIEGVDHVDSEAEAALPAGWIVVRKDDPGASDVHVDVPSDDVSVADLDEKRRRKRKVQMLKADDEQQLVYGIVLEPNVEDSQSDVCSPAEIEKAAHRFLYANRPIGIQHGEMAPDTVRPVESYIAPADFELGGEKVSKGSWVLVAHVPDQSLWQAVKEEGFTGWSVAGTGVRTPLDPEQLPTVVKQDNALVETIKEFVSTLGAAIGLMATKETPAPVFTVNVPKQDPPVVHNDIVVQPAHAPQVTFSLPEMKPPVVHIDVAPAQVTVEPVVKVELPAPRAIRIERDGVGRGKRLVPENR